MLIVFIAVSMIASGYNGTYNVKVGDTFTVNTTYHNYTNAVLWDYDYNIVQPVGTIYATSTSVTFRAIAASPSAGTVIQAVTYYFKNGTTSSGINKAVDNWKVFVTDPIILVSDISVYPSSLEMNVDDYESLSATVLPTNATNRSVTWRSDNPTTASVNNYGSVTAKSPGRATIYCTASDGSGVYGTCDVWVSNPTVLVSKITVNPSSLEMNVGDKEALNSTVLPTNATNRNVTWSSSNSTIASVNNYGSVTAKSPGRATIYCTATDGSGIYGICDVKVNDINVLVSDISLSETYGLLYIGQTKQLTATILPESATNKNVTWKSSSTSVATVSSTGLVTAVGKGNTSITCAATDGSGVSAFCSINVTDDPSPRFDVVSQTCNKTTLSQDEPLVVSATFKNLDTPRMVKTKVGIFDKDMNNICESAIDEREFKTDALVTIDYNIDLTDVPVGTYKVAAMHFSLWLDDNKYWWTYDKVQEIVITAPQQGTDAVDLSLSSVTCGNEYPEQLTTDDILHLSATFTNKGAAGTAYTVPVLLSKDEFPKIAIRGDFQLDNFAIGNTVVNYSLSLDTAIAGNYYATVLRYDEYDDKLYYNSNCLIPVTVQSAGDQRGDMNGDGQVNGTDLVTLTNIILGKSAKTDAADVNGDGQVNGTDYVALVNIVLGRNNSRTITRATATTGLSIEPFDIKTGETKEMVINLNNPDEEITLVQFDLRLPAGLSLKQTNGEYDIDIAGRTTWRKHSLDANALPNESIRFLLSSSSNAVLSGTEGAIITITLVADATFNGGSVSLENILLVTPDENEIKQDTYSYQIDPNPILRTASLAIDESFSIRPNYTNEMVIDLNNPDDEITLVQFDLRLPAGLSLKQTNGEYVIDIAGRTTWRKHSLDANELPDGSIRFLLASNSNATLSGTEGAIITMTLDAEENYKMESIRIDNILLVTPDEKEIKPSDVVFTPLVDGIENIVVDLTNSVSIYTLSGQRLTVPKKGVNIIGGKKVVVK